MYLFTRWLGLSVLKTLPPIYWERTHGNETIVNRHVTSITFSCLVCLTQVYSRDNHHKWVPLLNTS